MFVIINLLLIDVTAVNACVGARPLSMGGAFVGVADDANATYWNPAGLAQLKPNMPYFTGMHTTTNRDEINYQDYASVAMSITDAKTEQPLAFGVSYIKNNMQLGYVIDKQDWYWVSAAADLGKAGMLGINIRQVEDSAPGMSVDTSVGLDIGYLYKLDNQISFGLLIQDVNKPKVKVDGITATEYCRNIRPGFAFRPDKNSLISAEIYDVTDEVDRAFRVGCELHLPEFTKNSVLTDFAVRAGYYGLGSSYSKGFTAGFGVGTEFGKFDAALLMGDFSNTILLSGSMNFSW
ncbi:hypothetical protein LLG46_10450 [bacterium]|nr:hypothetical protein [bacterium]